jgi:disulfide bond formation protein DsbB
MTPRSAQIALAMGAVALVLILGALGFQYIGGYPPCEMCMWQRYPHIAAAIVGLGGGLIVQSGVIDRKLGRPLAVLTILLVALSGAIGVFHAGVEWHWWKGPSACTGNAFSGQLDLNARGVMCDVAAWRLFGISMAGYNALISLGAAFVATIALARAEKRG